MRLVWAALATTAAAIALLMAGHPGRGTELWPGSRYTASERNQAVRRGLEFLYRFARQPRYFGEWGHDLLSAFYNIAITSADPELRRMARSMGHERALEWRRLHPAVPAGTTADELTDLIWGHDAAQRLGAPNERMAGELRKAAPRFTVIDYLGFDPAVEPPPADVPKPCGKCDRQNARGATVCAYCGTKLAFYTRYEVFQDALINTYSCDEAGISLGAHYHDVLKWLPSFRPWPVRTATNWPEYYGGIYTITHVIYTYNHYSQFRVSRACFPQEFEYLKANLEEAVADRDPETMGEYLDTLRSFGLGFETDLIRKGSEYLLSTQNADGSWGNMRDPDSYGRYHPTWTAVDGLREYRWPTVLPCPVF